MVEADGRGTVIIVDDDAAVRESLSMLMRAAGHVTFTYSTGEELLEAPPTEGPACLLLDLELPGADGIEVQRRIRDSGWGVPVLFLTGYGDVPAAVSALKAGAVDFVEKNDFDARKLVEQVADIIEADRRRLARQSKREQLDERINSLSRRELEVARLAAEGNTNRVIGLTLGISERTVEVHRGRAMKKLALRTAAELARLELRLTRSNKSRPD